MEEVGGLAGVGCSIAAVGLAEEEAADRPVEEEAADGMAVVLASAEVAVHMTAVGAAVDSNYLENP